jgi:hypothetical protein
MNRSALSLCLLLALPTSVSAVPRVQVPLRADAPVALLVSPEVGHRWRFSLRNQGTAPITVVADRRLVSLEFPPAVPASAPGRRARRPVARRCAHPERQVFNEFAPRVTLAPGETYSELFDLRDTCGLQPQSFTAGEQVTVRYGWDPARATLLRSLLVDEGPAVLPVLTTTVAAPAPAELPVDAPGDALLRSAGVGGSAMRGDGLRAVVRVVNPSAQPTWTLYRNGLWSFEVTSPRGTSTSCAQLTRSAAPRRDYFVRLGARGQRATTVMPALWCPTGTFAEPGVYDVRALFESRADGEEFNLQRVFVGRVSSAPFALRVTRGDGRYRAWGPLRAP